MSVPNLACPMISNVVRLSHSRTSKDLVVTRGSIIYSFQSVERRSDFAQKTSESTRMAEIKNPGPRALRWWACSEPSARRTPSPRIRNIQSFACTVLG